MNKCILEINHEEVSKALRSIPINRMLNNHRLINCYYVVFVQKVAVVQLNLNLSTHILTDPGKARGCSTNTYTYLSYKIDFVIVMKSVLYPEMHQNCISGSKVTVILLKGLILPIGGVALERVCACSLRSRLVSPLKRETGRTFCG